MDFALKGNIIFQNRDWSTTELRKLSDKLDIFLQLNHVNADNVVAIAMERTPLLFVSIITLLNRNILFLPVNEELPTERLEYMLDNAGIDVILTDSTWVSDREMNYPILFFDKNEIREEIREETYSGKQELAYILYTSGSTGKPKAVEVLRRGLENFVHAMSERIVFPKEVRMACFTSEMFDIFFLESIFAIHNGMTVVLADKEERNNPKRMVDLIKKEKVNAIQMTPTSLQMIQVVDNDFDGLRNLNTIMVGGEKFPMKLLEKLQRKTTARIYNMYGPTETTIWSTIAELTSENEITIGTPVLNTEVYILDENGNKMRFDQEGEICIAGSGLAKGYRNNDEQTKLSFIDIILDGCSKRIYKTGDLGYQKEDGQFVCLGRRDLQIKIRGHRIELEEIEENLAALPEIDKAVTSVYEDEYGKKIVCFYIASVSLEESELRLFLGEKLPLYMIPSKFVKVKDFEYTTSKKIDRKKMLQNLIKESTNIYRKDIIPLKGECSEKILRILFEILGRNAKVDYNSTFEELGMDSLMYVNFIVQIEEEFQIEIDDQFLSQDSSFVLGDIISFVDELN